MPADITAFQTSVGAFTPELRVLPSCFSTNSTGFVGVFCFDGVGCFSKLPWPFKGAVEQSDALLIQEAALFFPIFPAPKCFLLPALVLIYTPGKAVRIPKPPRNRSCFWYVSFQLENKLHWLTLEPDKGASMRDGGE